MKLQERNDAINYQFESLVYIAQNYLKQGYPEAPDPMEYANGIKERLDEIDSLCSIPIKD